REEVNHKTRIAGHTLELCGGSIHFLPNERNYGFQGDKLVAADAPGHSRLSLDLLFGAATGIANPRAVVVLSGMLTDDDGISGLAKLSAEGVPIVGTLESGTPVFDMIDQFRSRGLMGDLFPAKYLLEHLEFSGRDASGNGGTPAASRPKFLVADDEEQVRVVVGEMLRQHGIAVETAADGLDAVRK